MADGFSVQVDDAAVVAHFDAMPGEVHDALLTKVSALRLQLEAKIKGKLSGDVLNVRSGALRRSIFSETEDLGSEGVIGTAASSGDVKYAAIHEFGYVGTEHVKAHIREISSVFGRSLSEPIRVQVRPFDRQMNVPVRSFMRSSLAEMSDQITAELQDAVSGAVGR